MVFPFAVVPSTRDVPEDGIYLFVLDEGDTLVFVYSLGLLQHSDLRGQFGVEDELSEISLIDHFLKVSSKGAIVYCEVTLPS